MPAFTFTADSATDQLTITAHGLLTGAGPATVRNVGGALPTASPALTAQVDYWVINTGANTIKLATTSANALAGVAIDILTNGTGTNTLEIGIPYRRPRDYAPGSQLKSADLNGNFDAWKDLHALLTGQPQGIWSGIVVTGPISTPGGLALTGSAKLSHEETRYIPLHANAFISSPSSTVSQRTENSLSLNPCIAFASLPIVSGMRITGIRLLVMPQGTATLRGVLHSVDIVSGTSPVNVTTNTSSGTSTQILTANGLSIDVLPDSLYTFYVEEVAASGGANSRIYGAIIGFTTPP